VDDQQERGGGDLDGRQGTRGWIGFLSTMSE
jgi:hypothetical protein